MICKKGPRGLLLAIFPSFNGCSGCSSHTWNKQGTYILCEVELRQIWTVPYKHIHENLDSEAKTDTVQIWLYLHTYEQIILELCEVSWNASFANHSTALFSKEWKPRKKTGAKETSDLCYHNQVKILKISCHTDQVEDHKNSRALGSELSYLRNITSLPLLLTTTVWSKC